jgi:hypothetical protein
VLRFAAVLMLLYAAPVAAQGAAQGGSPFFGEWCGIETRLWVGPNHIGFNEHTVCTPRRDPATATAPSFRRHQIAQPVLAGLGAADGQGIQRRRAFAAGWGGVVWKTLGEEGPPIVNVNGPALRRDLGRRPAAAGAQQYRADHRPPARGEPARDQAGQARLARPGDGRLADGALRGSRLEGDPADGRGDRRRRDRAELRLPARHERARHGIGRGAGARIHRDGRALVQGRTPACR